MAINNTPLIIADNLSIHSAQSPLVRQVSFTLGRERVALVGESGSGKSLTARSLMGLLAPGLSLQARQLQVAGRDALTLSEKRWSQMRGSEVGMVMQDPKYALNPMRTVGWQVEEPLKLHHRLSRAERREKVAEMLAAVGLPQPAQLMTRYPHQLSGGMGQRVMLAIALIADPQFLIADEPTSALDADTREAFLQLLFAECRAAGASLLFVSHDQSLAPLFDRHLSLAELNRAAVSREV